MMKLLQLLLVGLFYVLICGTSISAYENQKDGLEKFTNTEDEIRELKFLIYQQKEQMDALSAEMGYLKRKVLEQDKEITTLKEQIAYETKPDVQNDEKLNEEDRDTDIKDERNNNVKGRKRLLVNDPVKPQKKPGLADSVAFSAIVNKAMIAKENETIPFGYVTLNEGNAYNASSGIFTCHKPGLYLFSFHILSFNSEQSDGSSSAVWLTLNGVPIVLAQETVSAGGNKDFNLHGSIVVRLSAGDKVLVASVIDGTVVYYRSSYFNGILIAD